MPVVLKQYSLFMEYLKETKSDYAYVFLKKKSKFLIYSCSLSESTFQLRNGIKQEILYDFYVKGGL